MKILFIIILLFITFNLIADEIICYRLNGKMKYFFYGIFEIIQMKGRIYKVKIKGKKNILIINGFVILSNGIKLKSYYIIIHKNEMEKKKLDKNFDERS
jgi:hypothetical protein